MYKFSLLPGPWDFLFLSAFDLENIETMALVVIVQRDALKVSTNPAFVWKRITRPQQNHTKYRQETQLRNHSQQVQSD